MFGVTSEWSKPIALHVRLGWTGVGSHMHGGSVGHVGQVGLGVVVVVAVVVVV